MKGGSTPEAILQTAQYSERHSNSAMTRHAKNCLMTNPTHTNRQTFRSLLRTINPTPNRETVIWRVYPPDQRSISQEVDDETFIEEILKESTPSN